MQVKFLPMRFLEDQHEFKHEDEEVLYYQEAEEVFADPFELFEASEQSSEGLEEDADHLHAEDV
jgi:hypothetical protein